MPDSSFLHPCRIPSEQAGNPEDLLHPLSSPLFPVRSLYSQMVLDMRPSHLCCYILHSGRRRGQSPPLYFHLCLFSSTRSISHPGSTSPLYTRLKSLLRMYSHKPDSYDPDHML